MHLFLAVGLLRYDITMNKILACTYHLGTVTLNLHADFAYPQLETRLLLMGYCSVMSNIANICCAVS